MAPGGAGVIELPIPVAFLDSFTGAFDFILHQRPGGGGSTVGGPSQALELTWAQIEVSAIALAGSLAVALPVGAWFGHVGRGEFLAIGFGNAGRAVPEIAVIFFLAAVIGIGLSDIAIALMILGIPPILTNSFVAVRQVDQRAVEAGRGMGMGELSILFRIELPLAVPTIMSGVRTAAINIVATATLASLVGFSTLGDFIFGENTYGTEGVIAGAILVALLALAVELLLSLVQYLLTPRGVKLQRSAAEGA
jgi:osmoprotectant transport system permease protein